MHIDQVLQGAGNKKNCCSSRSRLPWSCSSLGYSTLVIFSAAHFTFDGAIIITGVEILEVKRFMGFGLPEPQHAGGFRFVAQYGSIIGHAFDDSAGNPSDAMFCLFIGIAFRMAAELDIICPLRSGEFPRDCPAAASYRSVRSAIRHGMSDETCRAHSGYRIQWPGPQGLPGIPYSRRPAGPVRRYPVPVPVPVR